MKRLEGEGVNNLVAGVGEGRFGLVVRDLSACYRWRWRWT